MADAFKNLINPQMIATAAQHLHRVAPSFELGAFVHQASTGLEPLEFKARALHVCDALEAYLPSQFDDAAALIEASLATPTGFDAKGEPVAANGDGISGWIIWSLGEFVVRAGMRYPERALACLHALTQRFTAEFAIRPFLISHPQLCYAALTRWANDPSTHVRRLVSEGSRPRLPWGLRLQALVLDPTPSWPLLRALQDDPSAYVRRSVANHLNDIAKDHPDAVADWLTRQLENAPKNRVALLRHASRSLIKQAHAPTLKAWNLQQGLVGKATLRLGANIVLVGESLELVVELESGSETNQMLVLDYAVHFVLANGKRSAKVFKGWKRELAPGERTVFRKTHSFKVITTRKYYGGTHAVDLLVNGQVLARGEFELKLEP